MSNAKALLRRYQKEAQRRNIEWALSLDDFLELTSGNCYLCGIAPMQVFTHESRNGDYIYNGIDRVDNHKGYLLDNVKPCCKRCNFLKRHLELSDFLFHIQRILNFYEAP